MTTFLSWPLLFFALVLLPTEACSLGAGWSKVVSRRVTGMCWLFTVTVYIVVYLAASEILVPMLISARVS